MRLLSGGWVLEFKSRKKSHIWGKKRTKGKVKKKQFCFKFQRAKECLFLICPSTIYGINGLHLQEQDLRFLLKH